MEVSYLKKGSREVSFLISCLDLVLMKKVRGVSKPQKELRSLASVLFYALLLAGFPDHEPTDSQD